ncbi:MAG TPA: BlaI/MecI/CopY family transcriptional regulator, partial [Agromyces sp.]
MASLGELERSVMELLWSTDGALTANELRDALAGRDDAGRGVATTTMLTVLSRLERKGFVSRSRDMRPHRYRALLSREEHTAELMREVLDQSSDRDAALARFVGTVSKGEA